MAQRERTPLNAPGPFFTERDCCISCRAPEAEAPELMAFDEDAQSCYFRRQPATPEEAARAINAVAVSCCDSVQYDGDDPAILARLRALRPTEFPAPRRWWQFWIPA
jgi:hypothetical protein